MKLRAKPMLRIVLCLAGVLAIPALAFDPGTRPVAAQGTLQTAFSPWENVEQLIVDEIGKAKSQVLVQAYLLTSKRISSALVASHRRGVAVQVMVDAEQTEKARSSKARDLARAGIPVWLETKYQNAHNKVIVIDASSSRATVITGSYNFTWTAQHRNAENVLIARDNPDLAARYAFNWNRHRADAKPLTP
jgi:phosphatidylserine/phosphatidylglycerophosphate/cardiolipin synthase-like enzyme